MAKEKELIKIIKRLIKEKKKKRKPKRRPKRKPRRQISQSQRVTQIVNISHPRRTKPRHSNIQNKDVKNSRTNDLIFNTGGILKSELENNLLKKDIKRLEDDFKTIKEERERESKMRHEVRSEFIPPIEPPIEEEEEEEELLMTPSPKRLPPSIERQFNIIPAQLRHLRPEAILNESQLMKLNVDTLRNIARSRDIPTSFDGRRKIKSVLSKDIAETRIRFGEVIPNLAGTPPRGIKSKHRFI